MWYVVIFFVETSLTYTEEKLFSFVDISEQASRVSLSTVMPSMSEPKLLCEVAFANGNTIKLSTAVTPDNFKVLVEALKNA